MATTTIYVPDSLWEELKPLVESKQINLSQLAARAARQELDRLKGEQAMSTVVRRLRAEKRGILGQAALARYFADEWLATARYEDVEELVHHGGVRQFEVASRQRVRRHGHPLPPLPDGFLALCRPSGSHPTAGVAGTDADDERSPRQEVNVAAVLDAFDERLHEVWEEVEREAETPDPR